VRELCGKSLALLGESPLHGFGRTLDFKAGLVLRLMNECHYDAFFIESGIYDFLNIQNRLKSGQEVTESMVRAAIGGIWATREVQPLIPFLLEKVKTGSVTLGGLDDQLGRGTYAQQEMSSDLVQHLEPDEKSRCLLILRKHTLWQYTADSPYGPKDTALILGCLDGIENSLRKAPPAETREGMVREYHLAMVDNLKRTFARDL